MIYSHNIIIDGSSDLDVQSLSDSVKLNINSLLICHPNTEHHIYNEKMLSDFIESRFSEEVYLAFNKLKPYAYKADLAKYCLLYVYGGIYADISFYFYKKIPLDTSKIIVFRDHFWSSPWDASNGIIVAPKKHPAFKKAIELVCRNVVLKYYGLNPLCPTGPALFGKALASVCEAEDVKTGLAKFINKTELEMKNPGVPLPDAEVLHCLTLDDEIIAVKRKRMSDPGISAFGVSGGNSYSEMWGSNNIYE